MIDEILLALGAEYHSTEGDHRKYKRKTAGWVYGIILPKKSDISGKLLERIIRQTGAKKKEFWRVYFQELPKAGHLQVAPGEEER